MTTKNTGKCLVEITWPWHPITEMVDVLRRETITVLIADTGFGKTTLIEHCLEHWACLEIPTRMAPTEVASKEVKLRMAARALSFPLEDVLNYRWEKLGPDSKQRVTDAFRMTTKKLGTVSFFDSEMPSFEQVAADMDQWGKNGGKNGVYIVDHIGQLACGRVGDKDPTPAAIRRGLGLLKVNAKKHNMALLLPIQANRTGRVAIKKLYAPDLEFAQGSSAIEQMAATAIFVLRPLKGEYLNNPSLLAGVIQMVRSGVKRYEDVVDLEALQMICLKSRDLGSRQKEKRGQWASRTLCWYKGEVMSRKRRDLESVLPSQIWCKLDDSQTLPTIEDVKLGRVDFGLTRQQKSELWGNDAQREEAA